jgi:signal transduction histidine kinase
VRRRLVTTYLALLALVLLALELPLASTVASRGTDEMVLDRLVDANRYASAADLALRTGEVVDLAAQLTRYHELYGIAAAVVDRDGAFVVVAGDREAFDAGPVRARLSQALAGERSGGDHVVWPWQHAPLALAVPVTRAGEVVGAVVTLSPTDRLRGAELRSMGLAGSAGLAALVLFVAVAVALARWMLRPVAELDDTAQRMAAGALDARVPADLGPPEVRRLARSFNEMADNVADALARQRAFVAQASHQLRNPLTSLRIRVDNLAEYVEPAGRDEHRLTLEETDRLGLILDGLLALARAERGRHRTAVVDAAAICDARVAAWQPLAAQRGIALRRTGPRTALVASVDTAVDQAVDALVDNALKFAGCGATVVVEVLAGPSTVDIHVIDDGPGLSDEHRRRAGERFWRAPDTQNVDGAGLGLPIASTLVEASGGRLRLLPAYPHGLDAEVSFPAAGHTLASR